MFRILYPADRFAIDFEIIFNFSCNMDRYKFHEQLINDKNNEKIIQIFARENILNILHFEYLFNRMHSYHKIVYYTIFSKSNDIMPKKRPRRRRCFTHANLPSACAMERGSITPVCT